MRHTRWVFATAFLFASAVLVQAGGLFIVLGNPDASPEARKMEAVVTLRVSGCHEPEKAVVNAVVIGTVHGRQQSFPVQLARLAEPGSYAVTQQWPREGRWVLQFTAQTEGRVTSTLVASSEHGVERSKSIMAMRLPAESDVATLLSGLPIPSAESQARSTRR